ncbi:vWA domain-containing protein [Lacipirellula parvula]|nr:VWA domain-containing protein [Lacipirellula parvula]
MLQEKLAQLDADLQSKLSASRDPNSSEIRRLKTTVRVINNQIQHIENKRGMVLGMEMGRDQYARITENPFLPVSAANTDNRLSTFSIDIDTASYANVRQFLMQSHRLPPPDAVRIEELVNYFDYDYTPPTGDVPFAANVEVAGCPWAPEHRLVRVGIKGREIERTGRPLSNLVFLIDVSGSMNEPNKLPLLVAGMKQLTRQLGENDRVAIVVYASSEGLALDSTPGTDQSKILAALDQLQAGGSTAGGAGIQLAYQVAQQNFIKGAVNRVILCTDGDFNVGVTSPADLERMAETNAKETGVFLTVLGFGRGNLNDAMMEQVADKGNGNYHYIDTDREARKVLVEEMTGTLVTIAKDVKIQVEFNPAKVAGYRLIGYENRVLAAEDFNDDKKDAGEIGAGHTVTALYEIVPVGQPVAATAVDDLKYAPKVSEETKPAAEGGASGEDAAADEPASDELLTLKIRYKAPDGDQSTKLEFPIVDNGQTFAAASEDFKFASAVASFAMLLRNSEFKGNATYAAVAEIAAASQGNDPHEYRQEFVDMVERAKQLAGE